jgi:hypothetical protein
MSTHPLEAELRPELDKPTTGNLLLEALEQDFEKGQVISINDALVSYYSHTGTVLPRKQLNNHLGRLVTRGDLQRVKIGIYAHED